MSSLILNQYNIHIYTTKGDIKMEEINPEELINTNKIKIAEIKDELENIRRQLVESAKEFIKDNIKQKVEEAVHQNLKRTKELNTENKLKTLKEELSQTIEIASQKTEVCLNETKHWIHLSTLPKNLSYDSNTIIESREKIKETIYEILKSIFSYAGKLIHKYGYIAKDDASWEIQDNELPSYRYKVSLNMKTENLVKKYQDVIQTYLKLNVELLNTQIKKEQNEAQHLWNKA